MRREEPPVGAPMGPQRLILLALAECAGAWKIDRPAPLRLTLHSDLPIGSGFGSSAALAVAVVAAFRRAHGLPLDPTSRSTGWRSTSSGGSTVSPSGVDTTAVLCGGLLWARRGERGLVSRQLAARAPLLPELRVFQSGKPAQDTGAVVAAVCRRLEERPATTRQAFEAIAAATAELARQLTQPRGAPAAGTEELVAVIRGAEAALEELGVVPAPVRAAIRAVEAAGGAAKISGAGALDGSGAGCVLVFHPDPATLAEVLPAAWSELPVTLAAPGLREEAA